MYEGAPNYPDAGRFWEIIERHGSRSSTLRRRPSARSCAGRRVARQARPVVLRLLGTVGEPINPEAWMWYYALIGGGRCPIVDTWWQTETGAIMITPLPARRRKPGSATLPFPGVMPEWSTKSGTSWQRTGGILVSAAVAAMRTVWGDHERYVKTTSATIEGIYFTGDGAPRRGRLLLDDGPRRRRDQRRRPPIGTTEIESALVAHPRVAEAAVVGMPDELKGQAMVAFVTLKRATGPPTSWRRTRPDSRDGDRAIAAARRIRFAPVCRRPAPARSCAASCARSPRARRPASATPRQWPTHRSLIISSPARASFKRPLPKRLRQRP